jgi:molecular chaperone GrpE
MTMSPHAHDETPELADTLHEDAAAESAPEIPTDPLEAMTMERDEAVAGWQRAVADFRNFQRLAMQRQEQAVAVAEAGVLRSILDVLDQVQIALGQDLEMASVDQLADGVRIMRDDLLQSLQDHGVQVIEPAPGDPFDPGQHEAMLRQEAKGMEANHIVTLLQPGYCAGDLVLRPAKVAVSPES